MTILGLRLSLPLPACPGWDDAFAREQLQFGAFLEGFTRGDGRETTGFMPSGVATTGMNVLAASRIVFDVVRQKYEGRLAKIGKTELAQESALDVPSQPQPETSSTAEDLTIAAPAAMTLGGCPMLDGSLDSYIPMWDQDLEAPPPVLSGLLDWEGLNVDGLPGMDSENTLPDEMWTTIEWSPGDELNSAGNSELRDPDGIE